MGCIVKTATIAVARKLVAYMLKGGQVMRKRIGLIVCGSVYQICEFFQRFCFDDFSGQCSQTIQGGLCSPNPGYMP